MTSKEVGIKPQVTPVYSFRPGAKSISLRPGGGKLSSASALDAPSSGFSFPLQIPKLDVESSSKSRKRYTIDELLAYRQAWTKLPLELVDSNFEILTTFSSESARASRESGYSRQPEADERDWRSRTTSDSGAQEASQKFQGSRKPYVSDSAPKNVEVKQTNGNYPQASSREAPQIVRSANPWMPRRADVDDKDKVMRTVKGILNKLTPEKFDLLLEQMISAGISTASILQDVIKMVFDKAVLEPTFCSIYAEMCFRLSKALPEFPGQSEEGQPVESVKPITFRRVLLNTCQEEFEGSSNLRAQIRNSSKSDQREELEKKLKMRTLGNIRLIGELFKQKMIPEKIVHACIQNLLSETKSEFAEDNVEALCYLLTTVGKGMEESARSKEAVQSYMENVRELITSRHLSSRIRFMCKDLIDLRSNAWVPRREEVTAKKLDQIHAEAEEKLGLRPGSTASMKGLMPSSTSRNALFPPAPNSLLNPSTGTPPMVELDGWETVPVNRRGKKDPLPSLSSSSSTASLSSTPSSSAPRGQSALVGMRKANIGGPKENPNQTQSQGTGRSRLVGKSSALVSGSTATAKPVPQQNVVPETPTPAADSTVETPIAATKSLEWNDTLKKKSNSLLQEFFSIADLKEALLCVQEMKLSGSSSAEFVNLAIMNSFEGKENARSLLAQLLPYLFSNGALTKGDIVQGFVLVGNAFEDITLDYPRSPSDLGSLLASCYERGCVDTAGVSDILKAIEDYSARKKVILFAATKIKEIGVNESEIRALFESSALIDLVRGEGEESSVVEEIEKSIGLTLAI